MLFRRSRWRIQQVRRMIRAGSRATPTPTGNYRGWDVWVSDGKALLFKDGRAVEADWFDFCSHLREKGYISV